MNANVLTIPHPEIERSALIQPPDSHFLPSQKINQAPGNTSSNIINSPIANHLAFKTSRELPRKMLPKHKNTVTSSVMPAA